MDICSLFVIIFVIIILLVFLTLWAFWNRLKPASPGTGTPNPYLVPGPSAPPGTYRTYITPEGADAARRPPPTKTCPMCGGSGTYDANRRAYQCVKCRQWF